MSRKNNGGNSGCFAVVIAVYIILFLLAKLSDAVGTTAVLVIIGAVILVVVLISKSSKKAAEEESKRQAEAAEQKAKEQAAEKERQKSLSIINSTENKPYIPYISSSMSFSCNEEELVNLSFREFTKKNGDIKTTQAHIDYLTKKIPALRALRRETEIADVQEQISKSKAELVNIHARDGKTFNSKWVSAINRASDVQSAYSLFIARLPNDRVDWISDFFQSPKIKTVKTSDSSALIFTPLYVLAYSGMGQNIKLIQYKDVSVHADISTELLSGYSKPGDEIQRISYLHTNSDGSRDMRYSYSNNPSYTYVYRGKISIATPSGTAIVNLNNKSSTQEYEQQIKEFLMLMEGKYNPVVVKLISHDDDALAANGVQQILEKAAMDEKKKEEQRKKRQAAAEAKRKEEKEAREAAEREKKRKEELVKNLTIVDGTLTNWYGSDRHFELPEGLATVIGTAFRWKSNLETVSLSNGITEIQANAFYGSNALRKITIPSTVSNIGKEAFFGCSSLSEIVLPKALRTISAKMFGKCSSLKTLTIPIGVKKIERGAFSECSALTEIIIPEGVTIIEDNVFENCTKLKKLVLPNSIVTFGKNVFSGCISLEHVVLGAGVKRIPEACFNNHQKLISATIASDVVEIGDRAFKNCQKLTSISFVDNNKSSTAKGLDFERMISGEEKSGDGLPFGSLERIGKSAFENCFVFTGISMKQGLRTIGDYAFANCHTIRAVEIPKSVQQFGTGVFTGCTALTDVTGSENVKWQKKGSFIGTPWLSSQAANGFVIFDDYLEAYTGSEEIVEIPPEVRVIGHNAFDSNAFVSTIIIPHGVTKIEEMAFANCRNLKKVQIPDSVSNIEDNVFTNVSGFVIQCSRGSFASSFRIRNKIPGEYISESKQTETKQTRVGQRTRSNLQEELSGLSDDELRVIMEMRRQKIIQKKTEAERPVELEKTEYTLTDYDVTKVKIELQEERRVITNNIFNLQFKQLAPVSDSVTDAEYETFVIDANGQVISGIKTISAAMSNKENLYKVTYSLSAQEKFDRTAAYYVILRYKGAGTNVLIKTQYQINIAFASDFDF